LVFGFPLLTAFALREVRAADLAAITAGLPMVTALFGVLRSGERPSAAFWISSVLGFITIFAFVHHESAHLPTRALALAILAVVLCAYGYAEGGVLARSMGGIQVIAWSLVLSMPMLAIILACSGSAWQHAPAVPQAVIGFAWVSVGSMFLGFVCWYNGLAAMGVARASQLQLIQPLLSQIWAKFLLGERLKPSALFTALLVAACMAVCLRARVHGPNRRS
jgi:drug/metabolite transporter (DMT)-like permease